MTRSQLGQTVAAVIFVAFTKILCPTDFSSGSQKALNVAARLAGDTGAKLVIVHSWYVPPSAFAGDYTLPPEAMQEIAEDAQQGLDEAVRDAVAAGAKHTSSRLQSGVPWSEVVSLLEHESFDLCVLGTHGRTGLARVLIGSVAEKVIRHSPCSVLAVRPDSEARPFAHVLVPTDFSENAKHALHVGAELVKADGRMTVLHVRESPVRRTGKVVEGELGRDLDKRAVTALDMAAASVTDQSKARVATIERVGYPVAETLAAIDEDPSIDLVVVGTRGRTGIKRVLLGSVAEKLVRHARCPVLVARKKA